MMLVGRNRVWIQGCYWSTNVLKDHHDLSDNNIAKKTKFRASSKQKRKHQKVISFPWKKNKHSADPCLLKYFNIPGYWDFSSSYINKPQCPLKYFLLYFPVFSRWITGSMCLANIFPLDKLGRFYFLFFNDFYFFPL